MTERTMKNDGCRRRHSSPRCITIALLLWAVVQAVRIDAEPDSSRLLRQTKNNLPRVRRQRKLSHDSKGKGKSKVKSKGTLRQNIFNHENDYYYNSHMDTQNDIYMAYEQHSSSSSKKKAKKSGSKKSKMGSSSHERDTWFPVSSANYNFGNDMKIINRRNDLPDSMANTVADSRDQSAVRFPVSTISDLQRIGSLDRLPRQSGGIGLGLPCVLSESGFFGEAVGEFYEIKYLYQATFPSGTTDTVVINSIAPVLDRAIAQSTLPYLFACTTSGGRKRSRFLQNGPTIFALSALEQDRFLPSSFACIGETTIGECRVAQGSITVLADTGDFRDPEAVEEVVLPIIQYEMQGNSLLTNSVLAIQFLTNDLNTVAPIAAPPRYFSSAPIPTPSPGGTPDPNEPPTPDIPVLTFSPTTSRTDPTPGGQPTFRPLTFPPIDDGQPTVIPLTLPPATNAPDNDQPTTGDGDETASPSVSATAQQPSPGGDLPPAGPDEPGDSGIRNVDTGGGDDEKIDWWVWLVAAVGGALLIICCFAICRSRNPGPPPPRTGSAEVNINKSKLGEADEAYEPPPTNMTDQDDEYVPPGMGFHITQDPQDNNDMKDIALDGDQQQAMNEDGEFYEGDDQEAFQQDDMVEYEGEEGDPDQVVYEDGDEEFMEGEVEYVEGEAGGEEETFDEESYYEEEQYEVDENQAKWGTQQNAFGSGF